MGHSSEIWNNVSEVWTAELGGGGGPGPMCPPGRPATDMECDDDLVDKLVVHFDNGGVKDDDDDDFDDNSDEPIMMLMMITTTLVLLLI